MKKQLLLFSLLFTLLLSYSQEVAEPAPVDTTQQTEEAAFCPHRISTKIAIGPTNNVYRRMPTMDHKYSYSYAVEAGYTYFFNENWGLGIGLGLHHILAKGLLNINGSTMVLEPGYYVEDPYREYEMFSALPALLKTIYLGFRGSLDSSI